MQSAISTAPSLLLTPQGAISGSQDATNREYVAGWAWDRDQPTVSLALAVYDGETCLGTVTANRYRADLRAAGIGTGRHGFLYRFPRPIRDGKRHHITVRISGTQIMLRDAGTGSIPQPVTRKDRSIPAPIPHFSLSPVARWGYFSLLKAILRPLPRPVYRGLAALLAVFATNMDGADWEVTRALLTASDQPVSRKTQLRLHWQRGYLRQVDRLLTVQAAKITPTWVARHVTHTGSLPPGGAILITSHHAAQFLGTVAFASLTPIIAVATSEPDDPDLIALGDPTLRLVWQHQHLATDRPANFRSLLLGQAARAGLRVLAQGGCVILIIDGEPPAGVCGPLLGRARTLPRGPVWFATHSGRPILPFAVVPHRSGWRLWIGDAVAPTDAGVRGGLEACVRQTLAGWARNEAVAWWESPQWSEGGTTSDAGSCPDR